MIMVKSNLFLLFLVIISPIRTIQIFSLAGMELVVGDIIMLWVAFTTFSIYYLNGYPRKTLGLFAQNLLWLILIGISLGIIHAIGQPLDLIRLTLPIQLRFLWSIAFGILIYLNVIKIKQLKIRHLKNYIILFALSDLVLSLIFSRNETGTRTYSFLASYGTQFIIPVAIVSAIASFIFLKKNKVYNLLIGLFLFIFFVISGTRTPYIGFLFCGLFLFSKFGNLSRFGKFIDLKLAQINKYKIVIIPSLFLILSSIFLVVISVVPTSILERSLYEISGIIDGLTNLSSEGGESSFVYIQIWVKMISIILENPLNILIGMGMNYIYAERILGYVNDDLTYLLQSLDFVHSHNAYLEIFAGGGIISLILYLKILTITLKYLKTFSSLAIHPSKKYLIICIGSYAVGHVMFESMFHSLANGNPNFYNCIFISSFICGIIDGVRRNKIILL